MVAAIFYRVRSRVLQHMQREEGDDARVFGYTSFVRSCAAMEKAAEEVDWLKVIGSGKGEHFVARIGAVPIRFYSGDPSEPSARWFAREGAELTAHQEAFGFPGFEYLNWMLRLTVKTDLTSGTTWVSLVQFAENGGILDSWPIRTPELVANDTVVPLAEQRAGVDIRPPSVEDPAETETETETATATAHGDD